MSFNEIDTMVSKIGKYQKTNNKPSWYKDRRTRDQRRQLYNLLRQAGIKPALANKYRDYNNKKIAYILNHLEIYL